MKKIINGSRYDTETAKRLGRWESGTDIRDLLHYSETLYRTKSGKYFLHGEGGHGTTYGNSQNGEQIIPIAEDAAKAWAEEHMDGDDYEATFGAVGDDITQVAAYLNSSLLNKLDAYKVEHNMSRNEIIIAALRAYL